MENFIHPKHVENGWWSNASAAYPTGHIPPWIRPWLCNSKRWPQILRDMLSTRHDCSKEIKGMLSGEIGKTIFKCWRFSFFLSYSPRLFLLEIVEIFFYGRSEGPRAVACTGAALLC